MNQDLIVCQGLGKTFSHTKALTDVNLNIGRGKLVGLLGPNGSGKTTLIKLLCGLLQPSFGSLTINGYTPGVETKAHVELSPRPDVLCRLDENPRSAGIFPGLLPGF